MRFLGKVIDSALRGNNNFCTLCLKIDKPANISYLNDIITLKIRNTDHCLTIQEVLESLLAPEINQNLSENNSICSKCIELATNSYIFIQNSSSNISLLTTAIENLYESAEKAANDSTDAALLYLSFNTENLTSKYVFKTNTAKKPEYKNTICSVKNNISTIKLREKPQKLLHYSDISKKYVCPLCTEVFPMKRFLVRHEKEAHIEFPCSSCGKILPNSKALKRHEAQHSLSFICQFCGRTYKTKHSYDSHINLNICKRETRADPSEAKFTCDHCNKKYTQKVSLRVHIQFEHGKYKAHICEWCGKKFWAQSRLKAHIVKHTKEKNFVCTVCGGRFVTKEALLYHTRLHTGERPYKCSECNSRFLNASRRLEHFKRYHAGMCLQCDLCPSRFNSRVYLDRHREMHFHKQQLQKSIVHFNNDTNVRYIKNKTEVNKTSMEIEKIPISELQEISSEDVVHDLICQIAYSGQEENVTSNGIV